MNSYVYMNSYAEYEQLTFDRSLELCFVTFFFILFF